MNRSRLPWLLLVAATLALLRWLVPPSPSPAVAGVVLPAAVLPISPPMLPPVALIPPREGASTGPLAGREIGANSPVVLPPSLGVELSTTGNAFAVRRSAIPVAPVVATVQVPAPQVAPVEVVQAPPPPPPPLQVIGTWDDGISPGVFVATPHSTVLARNETVLMSDYRVISITATQVSLLQISSQLPWTLSVPQNAPPARPSTPPLPKLPISPRS